MQPGGEEVCRNDVFRIVLVDHPHYPGFCRVILNAHVKEMTDLSRDERNVLMEAVWNVEQTVRDIMQPKKINLASFGTLVPHLHWHIIPRYEGDVHYPDPIWAKPKRMVTDETLDERRSNLPALKEALMQSVASQL
ncbi:MAG: hypothetical protein K0S28_988 [Paucimonas sp.]|jgi:diadenosine tetraphosphate (Ap4A) HIT family hydrolase|nr:hypothetical protein [Paucimonas sp.]